MLSLGFRMLSQTAKHSVRNISSAPRGPATVQSIFNVGVSPTNGAKKNGMGSTGSEMNATHRSMKSYTVRVGDVNLHVEKGGFGKKVVLLLPGALGSGRTDFGPQLDNLNKDLFTLVAWDPRGYGRSIPPKRDWPNHFLARDAEDAAKLMETLDIPQYSLLGWSDGGITAMILAGRYPERVKKLVVWGANSYVTQGEWDFYNKIRDTSAWSPAMRKPMVDMYGEEYFQETWSAWIDAFKSYLDNNGNICQEELSKISCPTLIVHGQKDAMVPQIHPDHLNQHINNSRLVNMPEGKHNLHLRYSAQFNSLVESFLCEPTK